MSDHTQDTEAAGRQLAIELLREAYAVEDSEHEGDWCIEARHRKPGQPQFNFVAKYLEAVDGKPCAAAGLASVLSDTLGGGGRVDVEVYERADLELRGGERASA